MDCGQVNGYSLCHLGIDQAARVVHRSVSDFDPANHGTAMREPVPALLRAAETQMMVFR
jgi:hypothetical protein